MIHHPLPCYIRVTVKLARKSGKNIVSYGNKLLGFKLEPKTEKD